MVEQDPTRARAPSGRHYLVVARVGDSSLHPTWTLGERTFDLAIDYYGSTPGRWAGTADQVFESKGSKWRGLHRLLNAHPHLLDGYDAVWFPDDDIATDAATISDLFALHTQLGLGLSQPSLTPDSYFTHLMTMSHPGLALRTTNFVEVMVPLFSREALAACFATFDESESGYGLDLAWQSILPGLGLTSAILDCVSVRHTRPLGSGSLYDGMQETPQLEGQRVARHHGLPTPYTCLTHGAVDAHGQQVPSEDLDAVLLRSTPTPALQAVPAWDCYVAALRDRVARAGHRTAAPPPVPVVARTATRVRHPSRDVDLVHLDADLPLALVVADDGMAMVLEWRAAGWQTVQVPPGHPDHLADLLVQAERFAVRAVDVRERDSRALERSTQQAHRAGCAVVVRTTPDVLRCEHQVPEALRRALGGCQACLVEWRSTTSSAVQVVAHDDAAAQWLAPLAPTQVTTALDAGTLRMQRSASGAPADTTSVIVFDRGRPDELDVLLGALARQRGLDAPPEVIVVPPGARVPSPRAPGVPGATGPLTVDRSGPAGFAQAADLVTGSRVLVLESSDVPAPWCLWEHADAAGARASSTVVTSPARAHLLGPDDPFTDALHALDGRGAPGARTSASVTSAAALARVHAVASAAVATAVLGAGQDVARVPHPTHTSLPFADLAAHRRGTVIAALAAGTASAPDVRDLGPLAADLTHHSLAGEALAALARDLLPLAGDTLREVTVDPVRGDRGVEAVHQALASDLAAHWAAGTRAVAAVRACAERGEPFMLAASSADERLVPLLVALAGSRAVDVSALRMRICLAPHHADQRAFASDLAASLEAAGVGFGDLPDLDVVDLGGPATTCRDAQVVLPALGEPWFPGYPVPLLALDPLSWLAHLCLAALVARTENAPTTPKDSRPVPC